MAITRVRAASCVLASLIVAAQPVAMATTDPQADRVEQLALDYLKTGAKDPTNSQAVAEAGIDFSVGMITLGVASLGVPGAGAVIALLGGLFSGDTASVPPIVDRRLTALEENVKTIQDNVKGLTVDLAKNDNLDRLSKLEDITVDLRKYARRLTEVPQMGEIERKHFVYDILDNADRFLPNKGGVQNSLWHWTNVRVRGNPQSHNVSTTTEEVDSLNVALPLYLQSIAVLAAAIDATGVHPEHKRTDPHLVYLGLGGDRFRGWSIRPIKGLKTLRDRANDLSCAAIAPAKSAANGMCDIPVRCTSPVTAVSQTVQFPPRSYDGVCNLLDNYDRPRDISTYYDNLIAEARFNIASVQMLVSKAGHALERAGTPPQVFKMEFYDADWLFAVDGEGRLFKFRHLMVTRPHKGGEKPKSGPRMVAATARLKTVGDSTRLIGNSAVHSESVPSVSMKVMPGADARVRNLRIHANLTRLAGDSHELSRAKLESGDWGNFVAVIVSEWFGDDLAVYGLKANGDLMWRDIGGAALGTVTSVKWLAAPADPVKEATQRVGNGWNSLKHVFSTGEGVVYGVASNGDLVWYRHKNNQDGNAPPQWEHHPVGVGWGGFTRLFSTGKGIIYAMKPDGTLVWYKHDGYLAGTGMSQPGAWEGPKTVGSGWQGFRQIFAADNGHIYAVNAAGELLYYNHKGWKTGAADWDAPVKLAAGWGDYTDVFAAMGADSRGAVIR